MSLQDLGGFLKRQRDMRTWSQAYVARKTGIEQTYLSRLERGTGARLPEPDDVAALAALYEVPPDYLMELAGYKWGTAPEDQSPVALMADDNIRWHELPPHVRRMVKGMLDAYFNEESEETDS